MPKSFANTFHPMNNATYACSAQSAAAAGGEHSSTNMLKHGPIESSNCPSSGDDATVMRMRALIRHGNPQLATSNGFGILFPTGSVAARSGPFDVVPDTAVLFANVEPSAVAQRDGELMHTTFSTECSYEGGKCFIVLTLDAGSAQINWIADAQDEALWDAIDSWERTGEVCIELKGRNRRTVIRVSSTAPLCRAQRPRNLLVGADENDSDQFFLHVATQIADSGVMHYAAVGGSDGARLKYVSVNVLLAQRMMQMVNRGVLFRAVESLSSHLRL
jgi:hypothetical protein